MQDEKEHRVRIDEQIRLKGNKDELQRKREKLGAWEATIKHQEEELQTREASLNFQSARKKHLQSHHHARTKRKKNTLTSIERLNVIDMTS
jgi:hypothetical protein